MEQDLLKLPLFEEGVLLCEFDSGIDVVLNKPAQWTAVGGYNVLKISRSYMF